MLIICCLLATMVTDAQFAKLHEFGPVPTYGLHSPPPISDGTFLYGTTEGGGTYSYGTIFKVKSDGTEFTKLLDFNDTTTGAFPLNSLISDGTFLYGTTSRGGIYDYGIIFKIKLDGTEFIKLMDFNDTITGSNSSGPLTFDGTFLYQMTSEGGAHYCGTVFKIKPDGTAFTKLLDFDVSTTGFRPNGSLISDGLFLYGITSDGTTYTHGKIFKIKNDGTEFTQLLDFSNDTLTGNNPCGPLISDGTFLYGTTSGGGTYGYGTLFKIKPDGTEFNKLLNFDTSSTGSFVMAGFISDGTFLYGMTPYGGIYSNGSIFKIKSDGTTFTKLFDFNDTSGTHPFGSLIYDGTFLYGATSGGGAHFYGTIFKIKPDGTEFNKLLNSDAISLGHYPHGSVISDGIFLYGMASVGGAYSYGTIFKMKSDGTEFTNLFDFDGTYSGGSPFASLIFDGTFLYGMTPSGGAHDGGTIFKIKPDGTEFTKLLDFNSITTGASPLGSLFSDGTFLYGTTAGGGEYNRGTVFKIKPDGTAFTKLYDFITGIPVNSVIYDGTFLYGMTHGVDPGSYGTIFKIKPDGTEFTTLYTFDLPTSGGWAEGFLITDGAYLYGMAEYGGAFGYGTVFKIKTDGTIFTKLLDFDGASSGRSPVGSLISDGTFLYGMTEFGGEHGGGTIFKIKKDGTLFGKLLDFDYISTGALPESSLVFDGASLYGMTTEGGVHEGGVIFKMDIPIPSCSAHFTTSYDSAPDNFTLTVDSASSAFATIYKWEFGDGSISSLPIPTHTFTTAGSYNVCMKIYRAFDDSCSYCQLLTGDAGFTINIPDTTVTAPACVANYTTDYDSISNTFTLTVDSATTAIATSYNWDFGDGSTSTLATPSHVYAVDSLYDVCMKIYIASGDSCSYCHTIGVDSAGNIIRDGGFSLAVHNARTGVSENTTNEIAISIYPNPTTGILQLAVGNGQLKSTATLSIYNVVGEKIYLKDGKQLNSATTIDLSDQPNGIYFMQLKTSSDTVTQKIIINK